MSSLRGACSCGKAPPQRLDDRGGVVHRQRGLGDEGEARRIAHLEPRDVVEVLDQHGCARPCAGIEAAHRALDFRVAGVADEHHVARFTGKARDFHVHLGHERTGGIEDLQAAPLGLASPRRSRRRAPRRSTVAPSGTSSQLLDEHRAQRAQPLDDGAVVHDFVPHDRSARRTARSRARRSRWRGRRRRRSHAGWRAGCAC